MADSMAWHVSMFICARAAAAQERKAAHWIHGANELDDPDAGTEGDDFCFDCCEKRVALLRERHPERCDYLDLCVDGGWTSETDSPPYCCDCGAMLEGSLTEYGVEQELDALLTYQDAAFDHADAWSELEFATRNVRDSDPRWGPIGAVVVAGASRIASGGSAEAREAGW